MMKKLKAAASAALLFVILHAVVPVAALANAAIQYYPGATGTEPSGLRQIHIVSEDLIIDLRGLAAQTKDAQKILVDAGYELDNRGGEQTVELVFVFGSSYEDFQVWLDDHELASRDAAANEKTGSPASWRVPDHTPQFDGGKLDYNGGEGASERRVFTATIRPGRHRLRARYAAPPSTHNDTPQRYWQFSYILAPAREWGGFGQLNVKIYAGKDWAVAVTPELRREGDVLSGRFDGIPADHIALTAQAPLPAAYKAIQALSLMLFAVILLGGAVFLGVFGWRRGYRLPLFWLWGVGFSMLWAILIFGGGLLAGFGARQAIPAGQASSYGYDGMLEILGTIFLTVAAFPVGTALWLIVTLVARRKKINNHPIA